MKNRRKFLSDSLIVALGGLLAPNAVAGKESLIAYQPGRPEKSRIPVVISTWNHGIEANKGAWSILKKGGKAIDAVERGVMVTEADPDNLSVGLGGLPDRDGKVTLDACIMDENGNAGSVCFLQHIVHPVSVARRVMEDTPHVILAGEGALKFALANGFEKTVLLTDKARQSWEDWKRKSNYQPEINVENHDTIGMLALDLNGDISGACTTSGAAFKYHGRVGDSPIIGAGLYLDNEIGGAVATGLGELVLKTLGSFLIVELMRNGLSPQEACETGIKRIAEKLPEFENYQVGYLALDKSGNIGSYSIHKGFNYAVRSEKENSLIDSDHYI